MYLDSPYRVDLTGRTATTDDHARRVRNLLEPVLFTAPAERVMRPEFGSGVYELLFDTNNVGLGTAADIMISTTIQRHLADVLTLETLTADHVERELRITLVYALKGEDERRLETFTVGS